MLPVEVTSQCSNDFKFHDWSKLYVDVECWILNGLILPSGWITIGEGLLLMRLSSLVYVTTASASVLISSAPFQPDIFTSSFLGWAGVID